MNAQSRRSGPPSSMTARKSAAVSAGGVNARRIAAARAAARQAKEQEAAAAEEERGNRCGNPFCRKQLTNRYARFCEDSAMCQWHRALKLQCQANAEAAAKAEEDDEDDRPLARLKPGKQKLKKKPSKTKTLILSGENERAVKLKESEVADKPFAIPRRKRSEAAADAASAAATTARTSVLEADSEATSAPNSPKQKLKKKKRQQKQAEVEETEAETKRRRKKLRRARDAAAASAQSSAASSPERTAADASLNDLSSAQASSASSAEDVTSLAERLKKRSLGQHPRDPRARRPPRDVAIREIGSDAEMGKTAAAAAAMPSTKKRRLSRRVSADDVLAHPASSPLTAASGVAPAAAQLPPDTSWKIPGSRAARAVTAAATATQTIKRMGIELVPLGVANQAAGFAGGGRYVQNGNRSATQSMRTSTPLARPPHPTKPTSSTPATATSTPTINGPAVATAAKPPLPLTSASLGLQQAMVTRPPVPEAPPPLPPTEPTRTVTPTSSPVPNPATASHGSSSASVAATAAAAGKSTRERISTSDYLKRLKAGGERRPGALRDGRTASLERSGSLAAELSSALPAGPSSASSAYPARHPEYHRSDSAPLPSTSTSSLESRPRDDRGSLDPRPRPLEDEKLSNQPRYGDEDSRMNRGGHRGNTESRGEFMGNDMYTTGQREGHHFPPPRDRYPSLQRSSSAFSNSSSRDGGYAAADTHFSPSSSPGEQPSYWRERPRDDPPERFARSTLVADPPFVPQHAASPRSSEGRWVSTRDRSRPDRDILEIEQATFSYHESFLVHMLSTFIQKLPHALEAVFNATKKPRKMNWYIKYTERIERICEPYVRVKVENTKAVVTVRDREWLALEGSSTVTLYTEVIKSLLAEAVSWRGLKDEAEKALEQFRGRFDNVNMSFVFLRAWNALKHQREYMSLPRQANYFRGDRLHHWNFVVGKVEIGSGSHEENREAFRLATVKALDFLLNLSSDRYGSRSASWRPSPEVREAETRHERAPKAAENSPREQKRSTSRDSSSSRQPRVPLAARSTSTSSAVPPASPVTVEPTEKPAVAIIPSTDSSSSHETTEPAEHSDPGEEMNISDVSDATPIDATTISTAPSAATGSSKASEVFAAPPPVATTSASASAAASMSIPAAVAAAPSTEAASATQASAKPAAETPRRCMMCEMIRMRKPDGERCLRCQQSGAPVARVDTPLAEATTNETTELDPPTVWDKAAEDGEQETEAAGGFI